MKKRFQSGIIRAASVLCAALASCANPAGNDSPPPPASSTLIQFVNQGAYPAAVYYDSQRSSLAANVGPGGRSDVLGAIPLPAAVFYPSFTLIIDDAEILFTPNRAIETRIDEHTTTNIPIPYLDQWYGPTAPLVQEAYLSIKNEGGNGFRLQSGVNSLAPLGQAEVEVNDGETAVYRVNEGGAGMYGILSSAQTYPLGGYGITRFEPGHLYTVTFKGAAAAEPAVDRVVNITNLSPQGDTPAPAGLRAQIAGSGAALSWNAAASWPRYRVYRSGNAAGVYSPITDHTLTSAAYTDNHASRETVNYYKVRGYSEDGRRMSVFSEPVSLALAAPPVPSAPVLTPDNGQLRAVWDTHPLAERYEVWIASTDSFSGANKKAETRDGVNSAVIGGLENGTRYYIWIKAVNNAGSSQPSPSASGMPDAFTQVPPAPAAPVLTAGDGEIAVSWQALATASSYTLWYGAGSNPANAALYAAGLTGTDAVISGLENGQTYHVWVQGWNRKGDGPLSPAASVKAGLPPGSPAAPSVTSGDGKLILSWGAVPGAAEYDVYYGTDTAETLFTTTSGTTAAITGLVNGTSYRVRLRAKNGVGVSDFGPETSGMPWLDAPGTPCVIPGDRKLDVSWAAVPEALEYEVYYGTDTADILFTTTSGTTAMITGLVNGTNYQVRLRSKGNGGVSYFSSSANGMPAIPTVKIYDNGTSEAQKIGEYMLTDVVAWLSANAADGHSYYLVMSADDTAAPIEFSWPNKMVSITLMTDGTERSISLSNSGNLFTIGNGVTLTLEDGVVLRGIPDNSTSLVSIYSGGVLVMNGGEISGNTNSSNNNDYYHGGGGVHVNGGAAFTMNGGEISGNIASGYNGNGGNGGGVYVASGGSTFTMNGGKISGNTAVKNGGGVYVAMGTFTMTDGEIIDNDASATGGGIHIDSGICTMSGGKISGNTVSGFGNYGHGGGVYVNEGTAFTMTGGEISGNRAYTTGGGVYIDSGTFTLENGKISGNILSTNNLGGGIYVYKGTFRMDGGEISEHTAFKGGGVCVDTDGTITITGGNISGNTASGQGGGIYVSGVFTMSGGEISGNTASGSYSLGGGIFVENNSTFTMSGGEISGNTSSFGGGGVYVSSSGTFTKTSGGGVVYGSNASEALKNSAGGNGDAVYNSGSANKRNTTIPVNEAFDSNSDSGWD